MGRLLPRHQQKVPRCPRFPRLTLEPAVRRALGKPRRLQSRLDLLALPAAQADLTGMVHLHGWLAPGPEVQGGGIEKYRAVRLRGHQAEEDDLAVRIGPEVDRQAPLVLRENPVVVEDLEDQGGAGEQPLAETGGEALEILVGQKMGERVAQTEGAA